MNSVSELVDESACVVYHRDGCPSARAFSSVPGPLRATARAKSSMAPLSCGFSGGGTRICLIKLCQMVNGKLNEEWSIRGGEEPKGYYLVRCG
jgi:hypothetical protein